MARLKKYLAEAVKKELDEQELLLNLLDQISHKHKRDFKGNKKSKDRGGNDGKKQIQKNTDQPSTKSLAKEELIGIIDAHHIGTPHLTIPDQPKLSPEQKLLINWDFEGVNISKEESCISTYFKNALATSKTYDIDWKVKKEIPIGSTIFGTGRCRENIEFMFVTENTRYLKTNKIETLYIMLKMRNSLFNPFLSLNFPTKSPKI